MPAVSIKFGCKAIGDSRNRDPSVRTAGVPNLFVQLGGCFDFIFPRCAKVCWMELFVQILVVATKVDVNPTIFNMDR